MGSPASILQKPEVFAGTAGWSVPRNESHKFPEAGTHLERYSAVLRAAEINSSFYRPHSAQLYSKWADSVPADFRFSVKIPKSITHEKRFRDVQGLLDAFCLEIGGLGAKLGCLLVQLPPSFAFEAKLATQFFKDLRSRVKTDIACEARHASWFETNADTLLKKFKVARVAADPALVPAAGVPSGHTSFCYYRLHGSPRMYYSQYSEAYIKRLARSIGKLPAAKCVWCFFDNTASGAAASNALQLADIFASERT